MNNNRQRVSVPILGLDTSTTDTQVKDGAMQELHNLRYSGDAWRDVKPFKEKHRAQCAYKIVYQHPEDADNYYIAVETTDNGALNLLRIDINQAQTPIQIIAENIPSDYVLSHYGSILIVGTKSKTSTDFYYFYDQTYSRFNYPAPPRSRVMPMCYVEDSILPGGNGENSSYSWVKRLRTSDGTTGNTVYKIANVEEKQPSQAAIEDDYFWGEICYFVAYRMRDGAIVCRSALDIIASEVNNCFDDLKIAAFGHPGQYYGNPMPICRNYLGRTYDSAENKGNIVLISMDQPTSPDEQWGDTLPLTTNAFRICPLIKIKIDKEHVNTNLIKEVCIYSTRVNPIWDIERLIEHGTFSNGEEYDFKRFYANNHLPEQPFYLVDSISIEKFQNGEYNYRLSADLLEDIEQKQTIDASTSHLVLFDKALEYNERLHVAPAQELYEGFGKGLFIDDSLLNDSEYGVATTLSIGEDIYTVYAQADGMLLSGPDSNLKKILSYPDYRASRMFVATYANGVYTKSAPYKLKEALATNYAYRCGTDSGARINTTDFNNDPVQYVCNYVKYSNAHEYDEDDREEFIPTSYVRSDNTMRVSKDDNPLSWPLAYSYAIGTKENNIIAINSGAIEMSDAKFGELQLFAFTDQGIFVLRQGSGEILYESTKPTLNYDKIINPKTLAVNYNVIYIASKGVYALYSNQAELISAAINDRNNMPPIDFLSRADMAYLPKYSEIVFYKENDPKAYTFSLESKTWSTRDWDYGYMIDNHQSVLPGTSLQRIYDTTEEVRILNPDRVRLVSRPIKFGNLEFKRIETIVTRMQNDFENFRCDFEIQASNDCVTWTTLRNTGAVTGTYNVLIRRTPFSAKYFRIILDGEAVGDIAISAFDVEYYLRFLHRLR